jgi:DNA-binding transcriptional regulator YdaS (Cro superfamily)
MPKIRNAGQFGCPTYNQAAKIIQRFGGEAKLARLIGISRVSVYRWQYKRPYGSDGLIPSANIEKIKGVARLEGILLRDEDWTPQVVKYDEASQPITKVKRVVRSVADLLA